MFAFIWFLVSSDNYFTDGSSVNYGNKVHIWYKYSYIKKMTNVKELVWHYFTFIWKNKRQRCFCKIKMRENTSFGLGFFPGYAFLLFQEESSVQALIDACIEEDGKLYLCVSSPTIKDKPVSTQSVACRLWLPSV